MMKSRFYFMLSLVLFLIAFTHISHAQPVVKLRNIEPATGAGFNLVTDADGRLTYVASLSGEIDVNLTPVAYIPTASGNTNNLNEVVLDPNGDTWLIDADGDALQINVLIDGSETQITPGTNVSITGAGTLADPYVITATGGGGGGGLDEDPTNELQTISKSGSTVTLSDGGGSFTDSEGTDDQLAAEVPITDSGGYFTGTEVETALQELGADVDALSAGGSDGDGFKDGSGTVPANTTLSIIDSFMIDGVRFLPGGIIDTVATINGNQVPQGSGTFALLSDLPQNTSDLTNDSGFITSPDDADADASNELQTISKSGSTVTLSNGGGSFTDDVNDADADASNELQTISKSGSTVTLSDGGGSFTDAVDDADADASNELQTISKSGSTVTLSDGGGSFTDSEGTDDQNAAEVPITDSGGYFTGSEVEAALQELGADVDALSAGGSDGDGFKDGSGTVPANTTLSIIDSFMIDGVRFLPGGIIDTVATINGNQVPQGSGTFALLSDLPQNTSDLTNDSGFITSPDDADADASNELQTISKSGSTVTLSDGGGSFTDSEGTDDQLAAEVPILDVGGHFTGTEVETALQELGAAQTADADADASNELQTISKSGSTVTLSDGGGSFTDSEGTDDQNAAEVPITDSGGYFTGSEVEAALQELGADVDALSAGGSDGDGFKDGSGTVPANTTLSIIDSFMIDGVRFLPGGIIDTVATINGNQVPQGSGTFALLSDLPQNTSDLTNDSGFITSPDDADADASNELQTISKSGSTVTLSDGGGSFTDSEGTDDQLAAEVPILDVGGHFTGTEVETALQELGADQAADNDADASNELQTISKSGSTVTLSDGGGSFTDAVNDADADASNELQTISKSGSTVTLSDGGGSFTDSEGTDDQNAAEVSISDAGTYYTAGDVEGALQELGADQAADNDADASNELQTISKSGSTVTLSDGGGSFTDAVNDADADASNELQTISKSGSTVTLSDGGGSFTDAVNDADADASNELQTISKSGSTVTLSDGGGSFTDSEGTDDQLASEVPIIDAGTYYTAGDVEAALQELGADQAADNDADASNELQTISKSGSTVTLSDGGGSFTDSEGTDDQLASEVPIIDAGGHFTATDVEGALQELGAGGGGGLDEDPTNELQDLTLSGYDLDLSDGGGTVDLSWIADVSNPYFFESIDNNALTTRDTFDTNVELGNSNDFGIIPKLIPDPYNGILYVVFRAATTHLQGHDMQVVLRKSTDGGLTWTGANGSGTHTVIADQYGSNEMDCSGGAVTPTGRLVLFVREFNGSSWIGNDHIYSDDGGLTWSAPVATAEGTQLGYMYDSRFVLGETGELIFGQRTIQGDRYIKYYHSFDNGATWALRSTALNNSDKGWNFGEIVTRDLGSGVFVAISRLSAINDDGDNLPFLIVSRDYGRTWAGGSQTLDFQNVQDADHNSGFLPMEGPGVSLGAAATQENVLPWLEIVQRHNQKYLLIGYYIRNGNGVSERLRVNAIRADDWFQEGADAIDATIYQEIFAGDYGGFNAPDGNPSFFLPHNGETLLWITGDNFGTSSGGPSDIIMGRADISTIIDDLENINQAATTDEAGIVELATEAETQAGSATDVAVTPSSMEDLIPKTTITTITGATKLIDAGNDYRHIFSVTNSGNNDCTLTISGENTTAGAYTFHFFGMSADTDFIFPADYKSADGSTNLGTLTAADNLFVTCYHTGTQLNCSYSIDQ
jgi:hypothetical protein